MSTHPHCASLTSKLTELKALHARFQTLITPQASQTYDVALVKQLKHELEAKTALFEQELDEFKALPAYESQTKLWRSLGLMTALPNGTEGVIGYDNKPYPVPSKADIISYLSANRELYAEKMSTYEKPRFILAPLAVSNPGLLQKYSDEIRARKDSLIHSDGSAVTTEKWDPQDLIADPGGTKNYENDDAPLYVWNPYKTADDDLRYGITKQYTKTAGVSKAEKVAELKGWSLLLIEDVPDVPADGIGRNGRKTPPSGTKPEDLPKLLKKTPAYKGERGWYLEEYLTYALTKLYESNMVIDDWQGQGKITWIAGNALRVGGSVKVPFGRWSRGFHQAGVGAFDADDDGSNFLVRLGVGR